MNEFTLFAAKWRGVMDVANDLTAPPQLRQFGLMTLAAELLERFNTEDAPKQLTFSGKLGVSAENGDVSIIHTWTSSSDDGVALIEDNAPWHAMGSGLFVLMANDPLVAHYGKLTKAEEPDFESYEKLVLELAGRIDMAFGQVSINHFIA